MNIPSKQQEFEQLQARVVELERELAEAQVDDAWRQRGASYPAYAATTGFLLGGLAAGVALLVNIAGAAAVGRHPLELIRVYLTFPLGEQALQLTGQSKLGVIDERIILLLGICLYLGTGMIIGSVFQLILSTFTSGQSLAKRLACATATALAVWVINFYGVLVWLQPLLCGGNWIVNPQFHPIWVAGGTHLVFGWMMALLYPLGEFPSVPKPLENS